MFRSAFQEDVLDFLPVLYGKEFHDTDSKPDLCN